MGRMSHCFPSKNAPVRRPFMTSQSTRRSPNRRVYSTSRRSTQARRLRHDTYNAPARPTIQGTGLSLYRLGSMRCNYNRLNLPTSNRSQIPDRLLLSKPYGPSCGWHPDSDALGIHRSTSINNRPRTCIISTLLSSQHQL